MKFPAVFTSTLKLGIGTALLCLSQLSSGDPLHYWEHQHQEISNNEASVNEPIHEDGNASSNLHPSPRIAIIIDDLGNTLKSGLETIGLPGPITLSILPLTPQAKRLANEGHAQGKEIMVHTPMSNLKNFPLGPGGVTENQEQTHFIETLRQGFDSVPHAIGMNNHMGSQLTQLQQPMLWLMQELREQKLYFVDSLTSPDSVAGKTARKVGVPSLSRDVFLDTYQDAEFVRKQYQHLLRKAKRRGYAIAIGHPYPETLALLKQELPKLATEGIELVPVSQLITSTQFATKHLELARMDIELQLKSQKKQDNAPKEENKPNLSPNTTY